jgi:hypothetical protein
MRIGAALIMANQESSKPTFYDRFWAKVRRVDGDGCWEWAAALGTKGYGKIQRPGTRITEGAHRASYELNIGPIPTGLWVLHKCDNRKCVRPDHLFLGTCQDNIDDMHAKGRGALTNLGSTGARSVTRVFSDDEVRAMRERAARGVSMCRIAKEVGHDKRGVARAIKGITYRDVA